MFLVRRSPKISNVSHNYLHSVMFGQYSFHLAKYQMQDICLKTSINVCYISYICCYIC